MYDYPTLETENDKNIKEIHAFGYRTSVAATPGTCLVELFPWMLHIPERSALVSMYCLPDSDIRRCIRFARWKYEGREYFKQHNAMFERLFNRVRSDTVGIDAEIFSRNLLRHRNVVEGF